ncbi:GNAT family N-acetyltransferase [Streptomyces polygonati]|uniref:GNAT family N-acetyltransferase n=1 Tax=Streptomyces polygonati TaxID=1617087 RepID=A0ABV8HY37_9ACTN
MTTVIEDSCGSPATWLRSGPPPTAPWYVGPAHPADRPEVVALFAACSPETVRLRFFGQLREWPRDYLASALSASPEEHDAVVAYDPHRANVLGLASLAAPSACPPGIGELGVLVADAWQRQGVGAALLDLLLTRARARGVERVAASVLPGRSALLAALARRVEPDSFLHSRDSLTGIYKLTRRA